MFIAGTLLATGNASPVAAASCCGYQGCVYGRLKVRAPDAIERGTAPRIGVKYVPIGSEAGNVSGRIDITFTRRKTGRTKSVAADYPDQTRITGPVLNGRGRWHVRVKFSGCPYRAAPESFSLRVHR